MVHSDSVQFVNFQQSVLDLISLYLVHGSQSFFFVNLQQSVPNSLFLFSSLWFSSWFVVVLLYKVPKQVTIHPTASDSQLNPTDPLS